MFYTIYRTTNIINGKYYLGKHQTENLDDGYMGSGKLLKRAILKHGLNNFHKEILHICPTEKQMNILEKILVVPDIELNYNLCPGGQGGWGYLNDGSEAHKERASQACIKRNKNQFGVKNSFYGRKHNEQTKKIIGQKSKERAKNTPYKHTPETIEKLKIAKIGYVPWNKGLTYKLKCRA